MLSLLPQTKKRSGFTLKSAFSSRIRSTALPDIKAHPRKGFTLIELLVVITIIAILAAIALISFTTAQGRGRDARRKSDLKNFQNALELYKTDVGCYPNSPDVTVAPDCSKTSVGLPLLITRATPSCGVGQQFTSPRSPVADPRVVSPLIVYVNTVPCDPTDSVPYRYYYISPRVGAPNTQQYQLIACIENRLDKDRDTAVNANCTTAPGAPSSYTLQEP